MSAPQSVPDPSAVFRCSADHLPAIQAILNEAILHTTAVYEYEPRSIESMERWFAERQEAGIPVLGVERAPGELAGFATWGPFRFRPAYKYSAEHSVYVAGRHRGTGVGRLLLTAILAEAERAGLHMLVAGIDASNMASIGLHRSAGFTCCGRVREAGFKFGRWLDLEFWQRILATPEHPVDG